MVFLHSSHHDFIAWASSVKARRQGGSDTRQYTRRTYEYEGRLLRVGLVSTHIFKHQLMGQCAQHKNKGTLPCTHKSNIQHQHYHTTGTSTSSITIITLASSTEYGTPRTSSLRRALLRNGKPALAPPRPPRSFFAEPKDKKTRSLIPVPACQRFNWCYLYTGSSTLVQV